MHYCDTEDAPGVLLFCDATKAFDRVQQDYLLQTMEVMQLPRAFRQLFSVLLTGATTRIKVNGYLGQPIAIHNSVRQGCPCAPLAFLISLQPLLSLFRLSNTIGVQVPDQNGALTHCRLSGIPIPTLDGTATTEAIAVAMADDIALALKDTLQFPCVRTLMSVHE
eukprot:7377895-Prymnesium_polylepis.1